MDVTGIDGPARRSAGERNYRGNPMNESHFIRNALLALVGVVVVGWLAIFLIKALFGLFLYVLVGAAVVGGVYYLVRKSRSLGSSNRRRIGR
jgi:hypothetical protein